MSKLFPKTPVQQTEHARQTRLTRYLIQRDWQVKETYGTLYSFGWPDLYAAHVEYGSRWIEMKCPGEKLRQTQIDFITQFCLVQVFVWVLVDGTPEEYRKLFGPPNWQQFI